MPGPPGSDRAWEQVSLPDTNGNPVSAALAISTDGSRAIYGVAGGTDGSPNGFGGILLSPWFAERTASGWVNKNLWPDRATATGPFWEGPGVTDDLSQILTWNGFPSNTLGAANDVIPSIWRLRPDGSKEKLGSLPLNGFPTNALNNSRDGSVVLITSPESLDPEHPVPPLGFNGNYIYDFGSGKPELVSLLPGEAAPPCGSTGFSTGTYEYPGVGKFARWRQENWISPDGSLAFFPAKIDCNGFDPRARLYVRDLDGEETKLISGPPDHGPDLGGAFIAATPSEPGDPGLASAFLLTESSLVAEDTGSGEPSAGRD